MSNNLRIECDLEQFKTVNLVNLSTRTSRQQEKVEEAVEKCFEAVLKQKSDPDHEDVPLLMRYLHEDYLIGSLYNLPSYMTSLDSSKPWLAFWMLHSLALLDKQRWLFRVWERACDMLLGCEDKRTGGFGGGPGQMAHLATTYAAINAFASLVNAEALARIDRERLHRFLRSMKQPDGSFTMHLGGEVDVRGVYCALTVSRLCNIQDLDLFDQTAEWIGSCQTYEGGFGPCPGNEAHGGYTYCAVASLVLLNKFDHINLNALLRWITSRQMPYEGGFSGRTNKMVDGCYSFWQGGSFPLLHLVLLKKYPEQISRDCWLFDQEALQEYILCACQNIGGGLLDKPGRYPDFYHTCFCLSGLSLAQHGLAQDQLIGSPTNLLKPIHPVYNLTIDAVELAKSHFSVPFIPQS